MRKFVLTMVLILVALLVVACNRGKTDAENNGTNAATAANGQPAPTTVNGQTKKANYEISRKTYIEKNIEASYPQLSGLSDRKMQEKINEMLRKEALSLCNSTNVDEVHAECNYVIKWQSANLLSFVFTGYCQEDGTPHPNVLFAPFTIDINTGNKIELKDLVTIDEDFVKKVKAGMFIGACPEIKAANMPELTNESLLNEISTVGEFYLTEDSLGINVTAPHLLGDNAQFEVKYQDISDNIKAENDVWKEFSF
jgi:hypothetical protein